MAPSGEPFVFRRTVAADHARTALAHAWTAFQPSAALYCAPGVVLALSVGLVLNQRGVALLAAAGAFSAGFGAFHRLGALRIAPMLLASVAMGVSTAVGTVASRAAGLDALLVAAAALSIGIAGSFGTGLWWVLLQGAVFLVISGAHPGGGADGLSRGLIVLAGGAGQSLLVTGLRGLVPRGFPLLEAPNLIPPPTGAAGWLRQAREVMSPQAPELVYALALAGSAGAAIVAARAWALPNGYWAALTVLLVLRRGGAETLIRGAQRVAGTLGGAAAATLVAATVRPDAAGLVLLIGVSAWCAYATQWVNYGTFSLSVTSYVAFLLALIGAPEAVVATHRVVATLLGAGIATAALTLLAVARYAARAVRRR